MHVKPATVGTLKSIGTGNFDDRTLRQEEQRSNMAATTRNNANDDNPQGGGSGTRANNSNNNNNNNNNNEDSSSNNQQVMDDAELKLKRQTLEQRKQELERVLSEKNWLLQQIQKQETQILNGNYEYLNVNEIFAMLARQYKKEHGGGGGGGGGSDIGSTAVLRRKTIGGSSCKENQLNHNNNNTPNRQSEISNRSSEYDNYPGSSSNNGECNTPAFNVGATQMQLTKSQSLRKRGTTTPTVQTLGGNYQYLQAQQRQQQQQQQQLMQHQMLQNQLQYAAMLQHQHYHQQQQQQLHPHQTQDEQQLLHHQQQQQQQQPQQYNQQISPTQSHLCQYPLDAVSLYSVNSASVATLRQQHIAPQQQPIVVQCDRYYLSPTHQNYSDGGFIKSSQNIKKYISPQPSPTQHGIATTQLLPHIQQTHAYQQDLLMATAVTAEQKFLQQQPQQQQHFLTLQQLQPHNLLHPHTQQHISSRQLDAISLAPSYISVDVDSGAAHNLRWRSQSNLPPVSPHTPPHKGMAYNPTQIAAETKSHSSDMLSSNAYYNTSAALPAASIKSLTKPLDEISISSFNSETQKSKPPKPKQWLESSLDGPVVRQSPAGSNTHGPDTYHSNTHSSARLPANKMHTTSSGAGVSAGVVGGSRERTKLSSQSMSGAPRHYSMSAASHKHPYSQTKMLQDDDGRYAKLSQSTSYLNSRESPSISAAYTLDGKTNSTTIELPTPTTAFKYLPPKPGTAASTPSQLTPPPPPRPPPMGEKLIGVNSGTAIAGIATVPTDIRIESPKNITVVKPATFRPYQEETKPFEMSDFYKYSTKFRQKESATTHAEH